MKNFNVGDIVRVTWKHGAEWNGIGMVKQIYPGYDKTTGLISSNLVKAGTHVVMFNRETEVLGGFPPDCLELATEAEGMAFLLTGGV